MQTRNNGIVGAGLGVGSFALISVAGWVAFRLAVRQKVNEQMEEEGLSNYFHRGAQVAGLIGMDLNLPPAVELSKSIVPMWSTVMPESALRDIGTYGRQSKYWPAAYRDPSPLAALGLENAAFAELLLEVEKQAAGL